MEPAFDPGTSSPFAEDTYCPKCTYNLRGTIGQRCPECGYDLDAIRSGVAVIPWEQRAEIGRWRAYWRTARMFGFQPRRVSECLANGISYRSARHFRVLTVLIATASAWCATVLAYGLQIVPAAGVVNPGARGFTAFGSTPEPSVLARAFAEVWPVALGDLCILLYLFAVTGAASYFLGPKFLPPRGRSNAVAAGYYTSWPLVLLWVPAALVLAAGETSPPSDVSMTAVLVYGAGLALAIVFLLWLGTIQSTVRAAMPRSKRRWIVGWVGMPLIWLSLGVIVLFVLPAVVVYILVIIDSLGA